MRLNDLILLGVVFVSMAWAVIFPSTGEVFHPLLLPLMMILLFLSFLGIDFSALADTSRSTLGRLGLLVAVKLIILPICLYRATLVAAPDFALPVLLLTGISTGVVAPFMGTLVDANPSTIVRMVIVTSVLVPFTLPPLVKALAGASLTIPVYPMVRLLALAIFVPMAAVWALRRLAPRFLDRIRSAQFPVAMVLFAAVNLGVFSKYSTFFHGNPGRLLTAVGVAYLVAIIYYCVGYILSRGQELDERIAAAVSLAIVNNVLVIVFSAEFFGPLSPTVAAMYMFPYYTLIVPVKLAAQKLNRGHSGGG
ncbi:MAG: bile acid:sodium symporter [Pseudomonadota bacterium]